MRKIYGSMNDGRPADGESTEGGRERFPKFPGRIVSVCVLLISVLGSIIAQRCGLMPAMWAGYVVMVGATIYLCYWFFKLGYRSRAIYMGITVVLLGALFAVVQHLSASLNEAVAAYDPAAASAIDEAAEWHAPIYTRMGIIIMVVAIVARLILSFIRVYVSMRQGDERAWEIRRKLRPVRLALIILVLIGVALVAI